MTAKYLAHFISKNQAKEIAEKLYNLKGEIKELPGELDFNFLIISDQEKFILKISRPDTDFGYLDFQCKIIEHINSSEFNINSPNSIADINGNYISEITDESDSKRKVRLLTWVDGRVWSGVNPISDKLLFSLGKKAGQLTQSLQSFSHEFSQRKLVWDIAQSEWTLKHFHLFSNEEKQILEFFTKRFKSIKFRYKDLRKSVVHNDVNDNNIIVAGDLISPAVKSIIDFGDAVYTQSINDLAITVAYAVMNKPDPLGAALHIVKGYHQNFPIKEEELEVLYILVAVRLVISVTKSAINKVNEPNNKYLVISEKPAWELLKKWIRINENYAYSSFRFACGLFSHPNFQKFSEWSQTQKLNLSDLFPTLNYNSVKSVDLSLISTILGHESEYSDLDLMSYKMKKIQRENPDSFLAGGYLEIRPFYSTEAFKSDGNSGDEYRTSHLGIDIWVDEETPFHSLLAGKVVSIYNNDNPKDYGPTLILKHTTDNGFVFYTLYGHLTKTTLELHKPDKVINKGDLLGFIGNDYENGGWAPHLHFQIMLDLLGNKNEFPGVALPDKIDIWKCICPDPNLFFEEGSLKRESQTTADEILHYRKQHLGKSLSVTYSDPLKIVRGSGVYMIDDKGQKYLDTVNNVAHVGHEHPRVVKAGQEQLALLNTNTRYLNENINKFAEEILNTFPKELSVVHFVNSGSEANELALRMAKTATGNKDMIAVEIGYHGNTNGCIEISSYKFNGKGGSGTPEYTNIVPLPDTFRGIYTGTDAGIKYANHIKEQIENVKSKNRGIAGFICESIISCGGQIELPENYLKHAYKYVRNAGGVCIADEVQVGFGRVGSKFWGFELYDVIPDIVTIGKPIGNGHPLAAVVCTPDIAEKFANGMEYFNTFGGNPVSCAIGLEVLKVIKDKNLQQNALTVGNYLKDGLRTLQKTYPIIGDVRGQGLFLGFELVDENKNPLTGQAAYLANRMKDLKILMSTDGKDNNVLKIKPPIIFSKENADELLTKLNTILSENFMRVNL
ncbi:MAG: aminotransferase class III-fold pyridoxal phosphate-dependent enzyme [Melioribacteraceae bacterium]|nr:aminotransferase class III-fold pyridoxal phosphate-dependent enzyme [Melioribacteraceae bacterium]